MDNNKIIIEKILGVDLKVLTNEGIQRNISIRGLMDSEKCSMTIDNELYRKPETKIDIHLECDGYNLGVFKYD